MTTLPSSSSSDPDVRRTIFRVADITRRIKETLEDRFGVIWVEGEVSNLRRPDSGHLYFTLKDEQAQISAVWFRGSQGSPRIALQDGMRIRVQAGVSVYEARGDVQLVVRVVEDAGQGALQQAFEKLKKRLAEEGLFDPARKRPLPLLPRHIGIVTSPTGAALRDILQILSRRFPNLHIVIAPVKVQGEQAGAMIARAIDFFNQQALMDVLIVGRGGGSLEDLWAFNEETVARAIARSAIPVISAVGHEIDFTIADFAADVRAPTPSAAAELVIGRKVELEDRIAMLDRRAGRALQAALLQLRNRFIAASRSYVFQEPANLLRQYRDRVESRRDRMRYALQSRFQQRQQQVDEWSLRLRHRAESALQRHRHALDRLDAQLRALSPLAVLQRGYSVTHGPDGSVVRRAGDVSPGDRIETRLADGRLTSRVIEATKGETDAESG